VKRLPILGNQILGQIGPTADIQTVDCSLGRDGDGAADDDVAGGFG